MLQMYNFIMGMKFYFSALCLYLFFLIFPFGKWRYCFFIVLQCTSVYTCIFAYTKYVFLYYLRLLYIVIHSGMTKQKSTQSKSRRKCQCKHIHIFLIFLSC